MRVLCIQVCYAATGVEWLRTIEVTQGTSLVDAVKKSGLLNEFPEIDLVSSRVGIYGKLKTLDTVLRDHDRIEIYRALIADPKESRRRRADHVDHRVRRKKA